MLRIASATTGPTTSRRPASRTRSSQIAALDRRPTATVLIELPTTRTILSALPPASMTQDVVDGGRSVWDAQLWDDRRHAAVLSRSGTLHPSDAGTSCRPTVPNPAASGSTRTGARSTSRLRPDEADGSTPTRGATSTRRRRATRRATRRTTVRPRSILRTTRTSPPRSTSPATSACRTTARSSAAAGADPTGT